MSPTSAPGRPLYRGDVVLARFPFTDLSTTKRRPAVVVGTDGPQMDFTLAFISSHLAPTAVVAEVVILPSHPEFPLTGLTAASRLRPAKLVTLHRSLITRWLGRLGPLLTADLDSSLVTALSISTVIYREEGRQQERLRLAAIHRSAGSPALLADLGVAPFA